MIWHKDVATEEISQTTTGFLDHFQDYLKFLIIQAPRFVSRLQEMKKILSVTRSRWMFAMSKSYNTGFVRKAHGSPTALTVATHKIF
jgi:hypothetical protein